MTSQLGYAPVYHNNSEWPTHIWAGRLSDGETRCYVEQRTCIVESHDCGDGVIGLYCSECGNYIDENDNYCPHCGAKVVE